MKLIEVHNPDHRVIKIDPIWHYLNIFLKKLSF